VETVSEAKVAWPLPGRARRSVSLALEQADAERERAARASRSAP
jgi:hypothetical protein